MTPNVGFALDAGEALALRFPASGSDLFRTCARTTACLARASSKDSRKRYSSSFALTTGDAVAIDPLRFAVADGAKIKPLRLPVRVASGLLEQAPENGRREVGHVSSASFLSVFFPHFW